MKNLKTIDIHCTASIEGISADDRYIEIVDGQFEKRFQQIFSRCLPVDGVCFDIGANIGVVSIILDRLLRGGVVHAFEAGKGVFETLNRNIRNNYAFNVETHQLAVSDVEGSLTFSEDSAYGHALEKSDGAASSYIVPSFTIDTLARSHTPSRLDFIKLDIEGYEPRALTGASWVIKNLNPIFLIEINPWCIKNYGGANPEAFVRSLFSKFAYCYMVNAHDWSIESPVIALDADGFVDRMNSDELFCGDILCSNNIRLQEGLAYWL